MAVRQIAGAAGLGVLLVLAVNHPARGQRAEQLYQAGAFRAAADSFAARARAEPLVSAHWFNLGDALYRAGDNVGARAAWVRAARLDPREPEMGRALSLVPAPDGLSADLAVVAPLTPTEGWLVAGLLWVVGWGLVAARARWHRAALPLALAVAAGVWAQRLTQRYDRPVALVRRAGTALRAAPFGSAAAKRTVNDGAAVVVTQVHGAWLLVERGADRGWLLASDVARI